MVEAQEPSDTPVSPAAGDSPTPASTPPAGESPNGAVQAGGRGRRPFLLGALGGAAAVVIIAAILVAAGAAHFGAGSGSSVGTAPITFPATLAGFEDAKTVFSQKGGNAKATKDEIGSLSKTEQLTTAAYRQAYGGAPVGLRVYANRALTAEVTVIGIRASSPGVTFGPVIDAASLGENAPPNQVIDTGAVSCLVTNDEPAAAGTPVKQSNEAVQRCQRTGPALTVLVYGGNLTGKIGRQTMVTMTNEAWAAASKS